MKLFLCRWPNGDCSIVSARSKADAVERLDEVANAESCPMVELTVAQVHFALTDGGELALEGLGEDTEEAVFEFCYTSLHKARASGRGLARAVRRERDRLQDSPSTPSPPATELGRLVKARLDLPTTSVERLVSKATKQRLRRFKGRGKPS